MIAPAPLFPHPICQGYEIKYPTVLSSVNGIKVRSLRHLVQMLRDTTDEFVAFEWADDNQETIVLPRVAIDEATTQILEFNGIRAECSSDLRAVWYAREKRQREP